MSLPFCLKSGVTTSYHTRYFPAPGRGVGNHGPFQGRYYRMKVIVRIRGRRQSLMEVEISYRQTNKRADFVQALYELASPGS